MNSDNNDISHIRKNSDVIDNKYKENKTTNNCILEPIFRKDDNKEEAQIINQKEIISQKNNNDSLEKVRQNKTGEEPVEKLVQKSEINSTKDPTRDKKYASRRFFINSIIEKGKRSKSQILLRDEGTSFDIV